MLAYQFVTVAGEHALEVELHDLLAHLARRHVHRTLFLVVGEAGVEGVEGHFLRLGYAQRVVSRHLGLGQGVEFGFLEVVVSDAVVVVVQRVDVLVYLLEALALCHVREIARVGEVELAVEVEQQGLFPEGLAAVGHLGAVHESLLSHVLKPLAAVEGEQQVLLLGGRLQHARVGQDDGGVLVAVGHAVYHDAVELARLHVLALHVEVALRQSVVEDALRYLQLGALLLHRDEQLRHLLVGARTQVVLEIERADGDEGDEDDEGAQRLHQ